MIWVQHNSEQSLARAEDMCKKYLKAPDMFIQCILVYLIL